MQILIAKSNRSNSGTIKCLQECLCAPEIRVDVIEHSRLTEFMQFAMSCVNYEKYAVIFVDAEFADDHTIVIDGIGIVVVVVTILTRILLLVLLLSVLSSLLLEF